MDTITLDLDALVASVRKHAEERPDYVYKWPTPERCAYQDAGKPSCIVGHGFFDLGFTAEQIAVFDDENSVEDKPSGAIWSVLEFDFGIDPNDKRARWLTAVQSAQDNSHPWGTAVRMADREYPGV